MQILFREINPLRGGDWCHQGFVNELYRDHDADTRCSHENGCVLGTIELLREEITDPKAPPLCHFTSWVDVTGTPLEPSIAAPVQFLGETDGNKIVIDEALILRESGKAARTILSIEFTLPITTQSVIDFGNYDRFLIGHLGIQAADRSCASPGGLELGCLSDVAGRVNSDIFKVVTPVDAEEKVDSGAADEGAEDEGVGEDAAGEEEGEAAEDPDGGAVEEEEEAATVTEACFCGDLLRCENDLCAVTEADAAACAATNLSECDSSSVTIAQTPIISGVTVRSDIPPVTVPEPVNTGSGGACQLNPNAKARHGSILGILLLLGLLGMKLRSHQKGV